jgi:acyl-CoA reductase-like NAD-dependent aldehyde dehydrogenase
MLREAAAGITSPRGEVLTAQEDGVLGLAVREPMGVVAAFAPWNAPIILGTRAVAAPIAAGNTVVVKASEDAPVACALLVADVLHEAGLPDGVLNVITNAREDAAEIAETLIAHPCVRVVNFTGSTGVGRLIGTLAAQHIKPAVLELGGRRGLRRGRRCLRRVHELWSDLHVRRPDPGAREHRRGVHRKVRRTGRRPSRR